MPPYLNAVEAYSYRYATPLCIKAALRCAFNDSGAVLLPSRTPYGMVMIRIPLPGHCFNDAGAVLHSAVGGSLRGAYTTCWEIRIVPVILPLDGIPVLHTPSPTLMGGCVASALFVHFYFYLRLSLSTHAWAVRRCRWR